MFLYCSILDWTRKSLKISPRSDLQFWCLSMAGFAPVIQVAGSAKVNSEPIYHNLSVLGEGLMTRYMRLHITLIHLE